jgi:hypothetical protein
MNRWDVENGVENMKGLAKRYSGADLRVSHFFLIKMI